MVSIESLGCMFVLFYRMESERGYVNVPIKRKARFDLDEITSSELKGLGF